MNMVKGEVPLQLKDGSKFTLIFDMEALIEAEATYGKPMHALVQDATRGFMGAIRAMLYGALRAHHSDVILRDVSVMLAENGDVITEALSKAHEAAMPKSAEAAEGNDQPPHPRGKTSGASGAKRVSNSKASGG